MNIYEYLVKWVSVIIAMSIRLLWRTVWSSFEWFLRPFALNCKIKSELFVAEEVI